MYPIIKRKKANLRPIAYSTTLNKFLPSTFQPLPAPSQSLTKPFTFPLAVSLD